MLSLASNSNFRNSEHYFTMAQNTFASITAESGVKEDKKTLEVSDLTEKTFRDLAPKEKRRRLLESCKKITTRLEEISHPVYEKRLFSSERAKNLKTEFQQGIADLLKFKAAFREASQKNKAEFADSIKKDIGVWDYTVSHLKSKLCIHLSKNEREIWQKERLQPSFDKSILSKKMQEFLVAKAVCAEDSNSTTETLKREINECISAQMKNSRAWAKLLQDPSFAKVYSQYREINDERVERYLGLLEFSMREFVKHTLDVDNCKQQGKDNQTIKTIQGKEGLAIQAVVDLIQLSRKAQNINVDENNSKLAEKWRDMLKDADTLLSVEGQVEACRAFRIKHKNIADIEGGIHSAYTDAWGDSRPYRSPDSIDKLMRGLDELIIKDPENKDSYKKMKEKISQLNIAFSNASKVLKPCYDKDSSHEYHLKEVVKRTPEINQAISTLQDELKRIKREVQQIIWTSDQDDRTASKQSFGKISQCEFLAVCQKAKRNLREWDRVPKRAG